MRKPLVVLAVVSLALGGAFYAWSRRAVRVPLDDLAAPSEDTPPAPDAIAGPAMGAGDLARGPDRPPPTPKPPARTTGPTVVRTGDLVVTLAPPAGVELTTGLRIDAEPIGFAVHAKRLAVEQEDHSWRYAELPVGRWRVRAFVPGFLDVSKDAEVREGVETAVSLPIERGAMASWKVSLLSGEVPETVRVALLDGRGVPREATYETAATTIHGLPEALPALAPTGRILGLKPGTYRLRATSPEGESDEKSFVVAVGETAALEFTLRR